MSQPRRRSRSVRVILLVLLALGVLVLGAVIAVLVPILTHQSAGGSGQEISDELVPEVSAVGADDRTRVLSVETPDGKPADVGDLTPGEVLDVSGSGFDAGIGIYVAICAIPESAEEKPSPCLGGIPSGAEDGDAAGDTALSSVWITDDWAWRAFATQGYADAKTGSFTARITVPEPQMEGLDCRVTRCAIATRADHTASSDRIQDILLPVAFH